MSQALKATSVEMTSEQWRNDWYWVLDLHNQLFERFFASVMEGDDIPNWVKGVHRVEKSRKWRFKVLTKEPTRFVSEAEALRERLRG